MLLLASNSPRRRELLAKLGYPFRVEPSRFEEIGMGQGARETALFFARGKAEEVFSRFPDDIVIGADTVVSIGEEILGKPKDKEDAVRMLKKLRGRTHSVITGVCLISAAGKECFAAETEVEFYPLTDALIGEYAESGLPLDKAGAYGIQDGYPLVKTYHGSFDNVVGLPTEQLDAILTALGVCKC